MRTRRPHTRTTVSRVEPRPDRRAYAVDLALAVAVGTVALGNLVLLSGDDASRTPFDYLLVAVAAAALVWRRRFPVSVLAVTSMAVAAYYLRVHPDPAVAFPVVIAHYTAVLSGRRLHSVVAAAPFILASLAVDPPDLAGAATTFEVVQARVLSLGWFMAAGVMGEVARQRHKYLDEVEQRAADAERTREETARRRAGEERLRIARELHDSLTHSISVIKVQAGVAVHLARKRGEPVPEALLAIEEASADAVRELRATLDVLRAPEDQAGSGLDRLAELVERARSAGLPATVTISGAPRTLPAEVDRAAYRIVQESLTNVARHAGPASASVHLDYGLDTLVVRVEDDGRGRPGTPVETGVGLTGMRERVMALGGTLEAEPRVAGGFSVRAELPVDGAG